MHTHKPTLVRTPLRALRIAGIALGIGLTGIATVSAQSSWNPTVLVNTESFQTIDEGDGSTNIELRFGQNVNERLFYDISNEWFEFTRGLRVNGDITGTGSLYIQETISGGTLTIRNNANIGNNLTASGNITTLGTLSGAELRISGQADIHGALNASGAVRTDGNLTINADADTNDATITFGNNSGNETLTFENGAQVFRFSNNVYVNGTISGSTLTIDGDVTLRGVTYSFPTTQGGANQVLVNDGAGNLTWETQQVGDGSGGILSLHPEYPNAVYFASGSSAIGQLRYDFDESNQENYYRWTSTKGSLNDYWVSVRVRVPDNFDSWDPVAPIEFRYRTGDGSTNNNYLDVKMLDTTGSPVALTNGSTLANTSWTTASITGPESAGTFTTGAYFTIWVKLASNSTGSADAGYLDLNWETSTP